MPRKYKRNFRRRRRRPQRRSEWSRWGSWVRKGVSVGEMAAGALRGVGYLYGLVNSELYKLDTAITGSLPDTAGVNSLVAIAQGDGVNARTGNSIFVRSINWKGQCFRTTSGNAGQTVKLALIMDTQQVGDTAPAFSDIYQSTTPYSHLNSSNVGRFKVLASKIICLSSTGELIKNFEINVPMRHHVRYNGTASTDIQKGGLYVAYVSDQVTTNYPSLQSTVRVSYHDN